MYHISGNPCKKSTTFGPTEAEAEAETETSVRSQNSDGFKNIKVALEIWILPLPISAT